MMAQSARSKMIDQHIAALKAAKDKQVEAGWFESARYPAAKGNSVGTSVAYIARVQEFGATIQRGETTITIPARPFMRLAWSKFGQSRKKIQDAIAKQLVAGKIDSEQALGQIGLHLEGCIVESIRDGGWEGNAPSTIENKGFDKPLIDTGHMWQSVSSKVSDA